ncbi:Magnesium-transporting ATPase, P-type 1 [compost metagenome]
MTHHDSIKTESRQKGFISNALGKEEKISARIESEANNSLERTLKNVGGSLSGLTESQVSERLSRHGFNEVAHDKPPHALIQLLLAFKNPFVLVLLFLACVSAVTDVYLAAPGEAEWTGIIILVTMVIISSLLRFWQEYRSGKAAERLKSMVHNTATVLRRISGTTSPIKQEVAMRELVAGDIVYLSAGDMIPADIRLIESRDLFISQAVLTGEALPVEKYDTLGAVSQKSAQANEQAPNDLLDLTNICFMGTNVVSGTATAVVVATGAETYFGSLARNVVSHKRIETSFDRGVSSVSWLLIKFMMVMVPIVFLLNGLTKGDWMSALTFALAVAVGLTPEMLPMIVSANLAKGALAMSRRKVVVKRLNSVQNFGAMDVLCTDKTGTLTQDKIILEHHFDLQGKKDTHILELGWLNSFHQSGQKNLMDIAVVHRAEELAIAPRLSGWRKVDEMPFDFVRRRLSVVVADQHGAQMMVSKGAVEEMLAVATHWQQGERVQVLDATARAALLQRATDYNEEGYRVLIVATRKIPTDQVKAEYRMADEVDLVVRGFLTFFDPPKESAAPAIRALQAHGVAVKVLTGDNPVVTVKVCRDVGLDPGTPLVGRDVEAMDDATLREAVQFTTIFAKLTPLQKSRVVKALQANGRTVGFLGDGINDAAGAARCGCGHFSG